MQNLIPSYKEVIPYTYNDVRIKGFEKIISKFLSSATSSSKPELSHMLGIPASGKSTYYQKHKDTKFKNHIFVSFDAIMEKHSGYKKDVKTLGSVKAFENWELPARIAGYELLARAIKERKNIFFDHSGAPECHKELLNNVKKLGYKTQMFYIDCPVDIAIARTKEREKITKRHTPENLIIERNKMIKNKINDYTAIVDEFFFVK